MVFFRRCGALLGQIALIAGCSAVNKYNSKGVKELDDKRQNARLRFLSPPEGTFTEGQAFRIKIKCDPTGGDVTLSGELNVAKRSVACPKSGELAVNGSFSGADGERTVNIAQTITSGLDQPAEVKNSRKFRLSVCPRKNELGSYPVNELYEADDLGRYCMVPNNTDMGAGSKFLFSSSSSPTMPRNFTDPTVVKLGGWYFAVGNSSTANFDIYKSKDLVSWTFHMKAFSDDTDNNPLMLTLYNRPNFALGERRFCRLSTPTIDPVPDANGMVRMYFSALEDRAAGRCGFENSTYQQTWYNTTVMWVTMPLNNFLAANRRFDADVGEPKWLPFKNGVTAGAPDGGRSRGTEWFIPTTVVFDSPLTNFGTLIRNGVAGAASRLAHDRSDVGPDVVREDTAMFGSPFVFRDPKNNGKPWLLYDWMSWGPAPADNAHRGTHVAMFPLHPEGWVDGGDANYKNPIYMAYARNRNFQIAGSPGIDEGCSDANNAPWVNNACVAQRGSVFFNQNNNRYYFIFSRNLWDSSAHASFYKGAISLDRLANPVLAHDSDTRERRFLSGVDRSHPTAPIYGSAQIFEVPVDDKFVYYAAFHGTAPRSDCQSSNTCRTLYLKELSFDEGGNVLPLSNSGDRGLQRDLRWVRVPRM
jgi:hypothetical protein